MPNDSRFERLPAHDDAASLTLTINGTRHSVAPGWTVATALIAHGYRQCRCNAAGVPRGPFCLSGVCFECLVDIDETPNCQACLTPVADGMHVVFPTVVRALP